MLRSIQLLPLLLCGLPTGALAFSTGRSGSSTTGCTPCHGSSASAATTSTLSAPTTTVGLGEVLTITFNVSSSSSSHTHAGLDVSATAGSLVAGTDTWLSSSEITHQAPLALSSGLASFNFSWTAPSTPGTYTLRGVGLAVNGGGTPAGDGWDLASDLVITVACQDEDGDGVTDCDGDCDDTRSTVSPIASEICDASDRDEDCDGLADDDDPNVTGTTAWYIDSDEDGYGGNTGGQACEIPVGTVTVGGDCHDGDRSIHPGAIETCTDPIDLNCDGSAGAVDLDADGWVACQECDDSNAAIHPEGIEVCDGLDNDCTDEPDAGALDATLFHGDEDGDGFGNPELSTAACSAPEGFVADGSDCDDSDEAIYPGSPEIPYDGSDNDCDGADLVDVDGDGTPWPEDCNDADPEADADCGGQGGPADTGAETRTGSPEEDAIEGKGRGGCSALATVPTGSAFLLLGFLGLLRRQRLA